MASNKEDIFKISRKDLTKEDVVKIDESINGFIRWSLFLDIKSNDDVKAKDTKSLTEVIKSIEKLVDKKKEDATIDKKINIKKDNVDLRLEHYFNIEAAEQSTYAQKIISEYLNTANTAKEYDNYEQESSQDKSEGVMGNRIIELMTLNKISAMVRSAKLNHVIMPYMAVGELEMPIDFQTDINLVNAGKAALVNQADYENYKWWSTFNRGLSFVIYASINI